MDKPGKKIYNDCENVCYFFNLAAFSNKYIEKHYCFSEKGFIMGRLDGKVAIVTGGNSGVGAATALLLAKEGAKVVISARREAPLLEVADKIKAAGGDVLTVVTDISKPEDAKNLVAKTVEKYGKVDVLVNNAGVLEEIKANRPRIRC